MNPFHAHEIEQLRKELSLAKAQASVAANLASGYLNRLVEAKAIVTDAFCDAGIGGHHVESCAARKNLYLPSNHPNKKPCDCWVGRAAEFLKG